MWWALNLGNHANCNPVIWPIQTAFATMNMYIFSTSIQFNALRSVCNSLQLGNICHMLQYRNSTMLSNKRTQRWSQVTAGGMTWYVCSNHYSYNDFGCFNWDSGRMKIQLCVDLAVRTRWIVESILAITPIGQHIWVFENSSWWLQQSLWILQASLLPIFPFLRNITVMDMEEQLPGMNSKFLIWRLKNGVLASCVSFRHTSQSWTADAVCWLSDGAMSYCLLCMDDCLLRKHSLALDSAAPLRGVVWFLFVICGKEFIMVAIERIYAILLKDDTHDPGRWDGELWTKTISSRWRGLNLGWGYMK